MKKSVAKKIAAELIWNALDCATYRVRDASEDLSDEDVSCILDEMQKLMGNLMLRAAHLGKTETGVGNDIEFDDEA